MQTPIPEWNAIEEDLRALGMSEQGCLRSTGIAAHRRRWEQGQGNRSRLTRYAADLRVLAEQTAAAGALLPTDFWDVETPAMQAVGLDAVDLVHALSALPYRPYIMFLARCFHHFTVFQQRPQERHSPERMKDGAPEHRTTNTEYRHFQESAQSGNEAKAATGSATGEERTAVGTVLRLLCESAEYARSEHPLTMTATRPRLSRTQQAIFLWQQVATGTNRRIPHLNRDAYTHSYWARFNVVEMWNYHADCERSVDELWGLSGFHPDYIRDPQNTNQIEHLTISALSQSVLRFPPFLLNMVETAQWLLHESSLESARADQSVNRAVARHLLPHFALQNPQPACDRLQQALAKQG